MCVYIGIHILSNEWVAKQLRQHAYQNVPLSYGMCLDLYFFPRRSLGEGKRNSHNLSTGARILPSTCKH